MNIREHFDRLRRLVELESEAEARQAAERRRAGSGPAAERGGQTLVELAIREETLGLGGQSLVTFGKRDQRLGLPWNRLSTGTPVLLTEAATPGESWRGIVAWRDGSHVRVAFRIQPETEAPRPSWRLDFASDEIARQRQLGALAAAASVERGRKAQLRDVLLGERAPAFDELPDVRPLGSLNDSQVEAVRFALAARDVAIVHGPPGTGKTTTLVEIIRQAVARGQKVLATAASNLAVDNLLEKLVAANERVLRLGHPARVLPELQEHTLDLLVDADPDIKVARKLVKEAMSLRASAAKYTRAKPAPGAKQAMRREAGELLADARRLEQRVVDYLLESSKVICATLTGLDDGMIGELKFDLVVIDEAAQATEPVCWIAALRGERIVLGGDACQLPPTIISDEAARGGLKVSLMERLQRQLGPGIVRRLDVQYRMHEQIMQFSSERFYEGTLEADESVREHVLNGLPGMAASVAGEDALTNTPLLFIDTAGAGYAEEQEESGGSRWNSQEADLAIAEVEKLLAAGVNGEQVAIITPYSAQARYLREQASKLGLPDAVEIDTVDGFQGREKEAVVVSLVRSNAKGEIGFLSDTRRMNVALTRARRKLIVIGDSSTIAGDAFYVALVEHFERCGGYRSVWG